jgi:hypothetical protein
MSLQKLANMNYLTTGGDSSASPSSNSMAAIASTPNMIAVVQHLALIKNNNYVEANNWRGISDNDSSGNARIVEDLVGRKAGLLANYATFLLQSIDRINSDRHRS